MPNLTSSEKRSLSTLMNDVKLKYVKPIQISDSKTVRLMEPNIIQSTVPPPAGSTKDLSARPRTVTWVSLPYFSLEKYSGLESDALFPIQTLLQAQFSRSGRGRDMQQAVCKNKLAPPGYCFHIAQIWCVVLDNCKISHLILADMDVQRRWLTWSQNFKLFCSRVAVYQSRLCTASQSNEPSSRRMRSRILRVKGISWLATPMPSCGRYHWNMPKLGS